MFEKFMLTTRLQKLFPRQRRRRLAALMLCVLLSQTTLCVMLYGAALEHLRKHDPQRLQNRAEVSFFYAPPKLRVGAAETISSVVAYLRELGYEERDDAASASYFVNDKLRGNSKNQTHSFSKGATHNVKGETFNVKGGTLNVTPRSTAFQKLSITFEHERIMSLSVLGEARDVAELEPQPMQNFVRYLKDDSLSEQRVRRTVITAEGVPEMLADAVTSAEDKRFFEHHGIDVFGIAWRVATMRGGGSSITQQLIKNTVFKGAKEEFWQEYLGFLPSSWQRKATDVFFALAAEKILTKQEIMAAYLSVIPLGAVDGVELHGVVAASQEYFGKPPSEESLPECAVIAGLIHQPSRYLSKVRQGDERALVARRNNVLDLMRRNHPDKYSAARIEQAKAEPLHLSFAGERSALRPAESYSRQFVSLAAKNLPEELAQLETTEGAAQVFTTLDFNLQQDATQLTEAAVRDLQPRITRACLEQRARASVADQALCASLKPQAALVALDARTGAVLALVGGVNTELNYATARRSPASAIKPFFYLKAIERGIYQGQPFTAATLIDPQRDALEGFSPTENLGVRASARVGLMKSYNFHAVATAQAADLKSEIKFVGDLTHSQPELTGMAALGGTKGSETSLLDLAQAYSVFPNNGQFVAASFHQSFAQQTLDQQPLAQESPMQGAPSQEASAKQSFTPGTSRNFLQIPQPERVADADTTFIVTDMMRSVVSAQGTAPNFRREAGLLPDEEVAAKTGTGMVSDLWFFAGTPNLIVGVWAGVANNEIKLNLNSGFTGGRIVAPLAAKFFRSVRRHRPELLKGAFVQPSGINHLRIDSRVGCASARGDVDEYFIKGREPAPCRVH